MAIKVTGDTHGEQGRMFEIDKEMNEGDYLLVCGDWTYLYKDNVEEKHYLDDLEARPYTILFVDGNHENFPAIYSYPQEEWNGGKIHRIRKNIIHLCRGQVFEIEGLKFFTFGGGYSLDKPSRVEGRSWWPQELPTKEEYEEGKKNLEKHNWTVDYIITHTINYKTVEVLGALDKYNTIKPLCTDELPLNYYLEDIRELTDYKHWFFGHFHTERQITYTRQTALWFDMVELN